MKKLFLIAFVALLSPVQAQTILNSVPTIGSSGATVPLLNGLNTWTGQNIFSSASGKNQMTLSDLQANSPGIYANVNSGQFLVDINRNSQTGTFDNTSATFSRLTINATNGSGYLAFATTNTNNNASLTEVLRLTPTTVLLPAIATLSQLNMLCFNSSTGSVTYSTIAQQCTVSSARFKDGIRPLQRGHSLDIAMAMRPVSYTYKPEMDLGSDKHLGFVAENIAHVAPELAVYDEDGLPKAIKQTEIMPIVIGAIQQLKADNDELRRRIRALEK